jgi:hypothetical protein
VEANKTVELKARVVSANGRESPVFIARYIRQAKSPAQKKYVPTEKAEVKRKNGR